MHGTAPLRAVGNAGHRYGLDSYFAVVVEATEEAVLNSMLQAETVSGRSGNISSRLPPTLRTTFTPGARDE
jgi:L-aminopeptidase/D-esterase-like protein